MADDEQFSLCWNNFNSNLSAGFHESLCRGDLVDVTLAAEGQLVKAHRLVLSVCSPYFRKMFTQMPANQHAFVFLKDVSHTALKDLIQFMYCGEVNVKQEALPAFISTAEALQIKGLTDSDPPNSQSPGDTTTATSQPQIQQISSPRVRQRTTTARATYKIDTLDDNGDKIQQQPTQIVIQTTTAPSQQQQQTTLNQQQHLQTLQQHNVAAPIVSAGTTTTTVVSHKRPAQRSSIGSGSNIVPHIKRTKSTIDPLEVTEMTQAGGSSSGGSGSSQTQQSQQISLQTTVIPASALAESKAHHQQQLQQEQQRAASDTEYIDLPMEMPTKAEPDYVEDAGDVDTGDNDGAGYVEDDSYGNMGYDETYFTENEDGPTTATATVTGAATSGNAATATTSKAIVKQQQQSYSDTSYVETGDQSNNDAQVENPKKKRGRPRVIKGGFGKTVQTMEEKFNFVTTNNIGSPAIYASTTKGGMKLIYDGHHFRYSYRKGQFSVFQCCYKENKEECKVKILNDQMTHTVYPLEGEHVHFVQATDKSVTEMILNPTFDTIDNQNMSSLSSGRNQNDRASIIEVTNLTIQLPVDKNDEESDNYEIYETAYIKNDDAMDDTDSNSATAKVVEGAENPNNDPNDFREKIKQRLQKALMSKKK